HARGGAAKPTRENCAWSSSLDALSTIGDTYYNWSGQQDSEYCTSSPAPTLDRAGPAGAANPCERHIPAAGRTFRACDDSRGTIPFGVKPPATSVASGLHVRDMWRNRPLC